MTAKKNGPGSSNRPFLTPRLGWVIVLALSLLGLALSVVLPVFRHHSPWLSCGILAGYSLSGST